MFRPALIVHGGAGVMHTELRDASGSGCAAAVDAGWRVLVGGGLALDAVCNAVAVLEGAPAFNAGVGSSLTRAGTVEMDASVMEGNRLRAGAVAVVRCVPNPVHLARAVMERTRHIMLAGPDADALARECGMPICNTEDLVTPQQRERWTRAAAGSAGTVGAVAVDCHGHVAAATSTGGLVNKRPGRVGDSAIIGAGTYADDRCGAASATGEGEAIMRIVLAKAVVDLLADGTDPRTAAQHGVSVLAQRTGGTGGIIVVDPLGRIGWTHSTPHMTVGYMRADLPERVVLV